MGGGGGGGGGGATGRSPNYGKPWYTGTTGFKNINMDIMECLVVMECIYVDAH